MRSPHSFCFYITTCIFNTNITNFSNVAERQTEGIIRFMFQTRIYSNLTNAGESSPRGQDSCNSWWKKENTISNIRKIRNIRVLKNSAIHAA